MRELVLSGNAGMTMVLVKVVAVEVAAELTVALVYCAAASAAETMTALKHCAADETTTAQVPADVAGLVEPAKIDY